MPVQLDNSTSPPVIHISGVTLPDECDQLVALLREYPNSSVNLAELEHLHTALLQTLLLAGTQVLAWPQNAFWQRCLMPTDPASDPQFDLSNLDDGGNQ